MGMACMRLKGNAKAIHLAQLMHEQKRMRQTTRRVMQMLEAAVVDISIIRQKMDSRGNEDGHVARLSTRAAVRYGFGARGPGDISREELETTMGVKRSSLVHWSGSSDLEPQLSSRPQMSSRLSDEPV